MTPGPSIDFLCGLLAAQSGVHWQRVQCGRRTGILLRLHDMGLAP